MSEFEASRIRVDPDSGRVVIDDDSLSWYQGVLGERRVAERLDGLGEAHTVLHSVPFRAHEGDIDHVVVSPSGVTIINTKQSRARRIRAGQYLIQMDDWKERSFIPTLADAVREAEARLSAVVGMTVPVRGVLCFVNPQDFARMAPIRGHEYKMPIEVVSDLELVGALHRPRELSDAQVERIVAAAVLPGTWHDSPRPSSAGTHIALEFDALEAEIGADVERRLSERAAVKEAERIAAKAARRPARAAAARPPVRAAAGKTRPAGRATPSAAPVQPRHPRTRPAKRMAAPGSQGLSALAAWPLLVALVVAMSSIAGMLVSLGLADRGVFDQLTIAWLVLVAAPVLFALADRVRLRRRGVLTRQTLLPWILLGPLAYLIARAVAVRSVGYGAGPSITVHAGAGVVGAVLVFLLVSVAALVVA